MVVAQVALALVLLIGAGLMLTSFSRLRSVDPGFRITEVVTVELMLPLARYNEAAQRDFYMGVLERLQANPVTAQSAMLFPFPFGGGNAQAGLEVVGQPPKPPEQEVTAELNSISPGYLQRRRASGCSRAVTSRRPTAEVAAGRVDQRSRRSRNSAARIRSAKRSTWATGSPSSASSRTRAGVRSTPRPRRHLSALHAVRAALHGRGRPHRSRRRCGGVGGEGRGRADRSRPADRRRQDDGADHRGVDGRAALPIVPDRELCGAGAAAGRGRRLRPDQLHGHAARARDRRAAGARRQPAGRCSRR